MPSTCIYALEMDTPLGKRRGQLTLSQQAHTLSGELILFTRHLPICQGQKQGDCFTFRTQLGQTPYRAAGRLKDGTLEMELTTPGGSYPVHGVRTQIRRDETCLSIQKTKR